MSKNGSIKKCFPLHQTVQIIGICKIFIDSIDCTLLLCFHIITVWSGYQKNKDNCKCPFVYLFYSCMIFETFYVTTSIIVT